MTTYGVTVLFGPKGMDGKQGYLWDMLFERDAQGLRICDFVARLYDTKGLHLQLVHLL